MGNHKGRPYEALPLSISELQITHLRNITAVQLECSAGVNVFFGKNGSGKTSILEALSLLSSGKSFRSHLKSRIIQYDQPCLTLFAKALLGNHSYSLGMEKSQNDETRLRLNNEDIHSIAKFANLLPVQLLHPHSYSLLEGGSQPRRHFMDWGVFHVEHFFWELWNNARRLLKQRNAALKQQLPFDEVMLWDQDLVVVAESVDEMRQRYIEKFIPYFQAILSEMTTLPIIDLKYYSGWNHEKSLADHLRDRALADRALGYTCVGPHRADVKLSLDGVPIQDVLSRGQQKLVIFALRFAQVKLLEQQMGKQSIFLIDDMPSELDSDHQGRLFDLINHMSQSTQFFLTGVHKEDFAPLNNPKMFHVEHGRVMPDKIVTL